MTRIKIVAYALFLVNTLFSQVNLTSDLYICYPLNGNANDLSGNLNHGVIYGASSAADRFGNANMALSFNGIDNYISLNNPFPDAAKFSISVWVNHTKLNYPSCILSDADDTPFYDLFFNVSDDGVGIDANKYDGVVTQFDAYPLGNYNPIITGQNLNNLWHHLVWVCDSASQQVYIDTLLMASVNIAGTNKGFHNANPSIGRLGDGISNGASYFQYFEGKMDEFRIYNRALSFQEVKALYSSPGCEYTTGLNSYPNHSHVFVYPTPFSNYFVIKSEKEWNNASLLIFDVIGREVKKTSLKGKEIKIDRDGLESGVFTYKLMEDGSVTSVGKLIAE